MIGDKYKLLIVSEDELGEICLSDMFRQFNIPYTLYEQIDVFTLRKIYNTIDLYMNLSMAEGFDLPLCEAIASGNCVLVTGFDEHKEIVTEERNLVDIKGKVRTPNGSEWYLVDENDFIKKFNSLRGAGFPHTKSDIISKTNFDSVFPLWENLLLNLEKYLSCLE